MIYALLGILIYFGFRTDMYVGLIVTAITVGFLIYKSIPTFYAAKGNKAYNIDDKENTIKYYEKCLATGRTPASVATAYVLMLMRMGELQKALTVINNVIANRKTKLQEKYILKQYRALIYFKQGEKQEALDDAKEIFESYKNTTIYGLLGYLMLATGQPMEETMDFCLEAYDYNSDDRDIVDNLVLAYYNHGDLEKAEELAAELLEMSPKFVEAHYHAALIAHSLGDNDKAREYIDDIDECIRTALTTVSEEEIEDLRKSL